MLNLVPDSTFFIQFGIFLACFIVMKTLVFDPYLKLLEARHAKTDGLKTAAEKAKANSEKLRAQYEEFIRAERKKVNTFVDEERKKISDQERQTIEAARTEVAVKLEALRKSIQTEVEATRQELSPLVTDFSSRIASKLVGSAVTVSGVGSDRGKKRSEEATQG